jgi:two-component system sensor histidine kinase AlgZ
MRWCRAHAAAPARKRHLPRHRAAPDGGVVTVVGEFNKGMITIVVRNPLPAANVTMREGNRLALANIKERMDLMYGDRATVKSGRFDEEYIVTLRFPSSPHPGKPA